MDFMVILSQCLMRFNIMKGRGSQLCKAWIPCPLMGVFFQPSDLVGPQCFALSGTPQREDWENGIWE